jgi:transposase
MENILEIYKRPYNKDYPVICMDESNKQHEQNKIKNLPPKPGQLEKFDTRYERNGLSNIFLSFEPLSGKRWINVLERRTRIDWAKHIQELVEKRYPNAKKIILVVDNLNIHTGAALYELLEPARARKIVEKLEIHYTPKHGSWLNMAEIELSHLSRQCLNRRLADINEVKKEVDIWMEERNEKSCVINWQFTTKDARIKLSKLYPTISDKINETL